MLILQLIDQIIKIIKEIFQERVKEEDLESIFYKEAELYKEINKKNIRKYYIKKHNSLIFLDKRFKKK